MTLNDRAWPFCVKICFGLGNWWVGVPGFLTKLFENLQSYPYTVSDKNVAQGRFSGSIRFMQIFAGVRWRGGVKWQWGSLKMAIFGSFVHCLPNILHTWPHDSFQMIWLSMTLGIFQCHWTVSHQISQKRCAIRQKLLYTTNRKSYTSFRLVPLLMTLRYIWRSFQPRLSFPRQFQQSLACFRVARSPSNSWASCSLSMVVDV